MQEIIVDLRAVEKSFAAADGTPRTILDKVDFTLREREIVALLGQSGSGKSTLLRIMAGLVEADGGDVLYRGQPLYGPARGISMVFQSFALFPWLTVQQNVEIGLEARGVVENEREMRAQKIIDMIGLSGFEGALPRELSGGMRQRVGIARALVVDPDVLLMDEAFSALDVLTGERLRDDILELWEDEQISTKAILVVSHNIQEAIMMADRVVIFASDPGRVKFEMQISLARPRNPDSPEVRQLMDEIYAVMTEGRIRTGRATEELEPIRLDYRLPEADIGLMEAVLERLLELPFAGHADLPKLAEDTDLTDEELLPVAEALELLEFAILEGGDVNLTELGKKYVEAENEKRQSIFAKQLLKRIPLAAHIRHSLNQESTGELKEEHFLGLLSESLGKDEAERVLQVAIEWGRHSAVYSYNYTTGMVHLPDTDAAFGIEA